jgi:CRISPR/Cas system-associated protein Cas5 (RAMP superfamily)
MKTIIYPLLLVFTAYGALALGTYAGRSGIEYGCTQRGFVEINGVSYLCLKQHLPGGT